MMSNKLGIYDKSYRIIIENIQSFPEIRKAILFGSRAMKNAKKGSDIDIAVSGGKINDKIINRLQTLLNTEAPIPYYVDIAHLENITNENLLDHIKTHGIIFYEKKT